jgi:hypothetical protein
MQYLALASSFLNIFTHSLPLPIPLSLRYYPLPLSQNSKITKIQTGYYKHVTPSTLSNTRPDIPHISLIVKKEYDAKHVIDYYFFGAVHCLRSVGKERGAFRGVFLFTGWKFKYLSIV